MQKVVLAGSAKFYKEINNFKETIKDKYEIINFPSPIDKEIFLQVYPATYKRFFETIENCDIFILLNFDKQNISGYIGAEAFAELTYALVQNILHEKQISIYLLKEPSTEVACYAEIETWLKLGKIKIWQN